MPTSSRIGKRFLSKGISQKPFLTDDLVMAAHRIASRAHRSKVAGSVSHLTCSTITKSHVARTDRSTSLAAPSYPISS